LLTTIPYGVIGGATVSVFATIALTGIRTIANEKLTPENTTVVGLSLAFGAGIVMSEGALAGFPEWVTTIFGNSEVILTTILAIVFNLILNQPLRKTKTNCETKNLQKQVEKNASVPAPANSK